MGLAALLVAIDPVIVYEKQRKAPEFFSRCIKGMSLTYTLGAGLGIALWLTPWRD
jgi:hypothetical protein